MQAKLERFLFRVSEQLGRALVPENDPFGCRVRDDNRIPYMAEEASDTEVGG